VKTASIMWTLGATSGLSAPLVGQGFASARADRLPRGAIAEVHATATLGVEEVYDRLDSLLSSSRGIRCPFWRRRAGDVIDGARGMVDFVVSRHKSLDVLPARPMGTKLRGAALVDVMAIVEQDILSGQYYVTGRLTQGVYDDSCLFDGPDPDMPVRSLQRYGDALRGLFDPKLSTFSLIEMRAVGPRTFTTSWRLDGALRLPGSPRIKPYVGTTLYELGDDGLICSHTENWSISALDAFVSTVFPSFGAPAAPELDELRRQLQSAATDGQPLPAPPPGRIHRAGPWALSEGL